MFKKRNSIWENTFKAQIIYNKRSLTKIMKGSENLYLYVLTYFQKGLKNY